MTVLGRRDWDSSDGPRPHPGGSPFPTAQQTLGHTEGASGGPTGLRTNVETQSPKFGARLSLSLNSNSLSLPLPHSPSSSLTHSPSFSHSPPASLTPSISPSALALGLCGQEEGSGLAAGLAGPSRSDEDQTHPNAPHGCNFPCSLTVLEIFANAFNKG